jgi:signal transduction histidine kinase
MGEEVRTAELFAERAATAIDNFNLYQQQQQFNQFLEAEVAKRTEELRVAQVQLIARERLAAIGEFASTIVHEIRNPLTTILMGLNYFKKHYLSEQDRERVSLALDEANRLQNLLKEILLYAKPQALQLEALEVNTLIEGLLLSLAEMPEAEGRKLEFIPLSERVYIQADRDKLKQVLANIVRNACEAVDPGGQVTCKIDRETDNKRVCICIHNGGPPIPAEIMARLTQPFYSTKPDGTGLGLAIVKRIVEAHNGVLSIQSDEVTGTVVKAVLPLGNGLGSAVG